MLRPPLTRRQFTSTLGSGLGAALVDGPFLPSRAEAARPAFAAGDGVRLSSNENPYGP